jgi:hypothetical protein
LLKRWIEFWRRSRFSLFDVDDTSSRVRRDFLWSWKKSLEANDLNRCRDDDTRDDNTQADEKSKRFEHSNISAIDRERRNSTAVIKTFLDDSNDDHHSQFTILQLESQSFIDSTFSQLSHDSNSSRKDNNLQTFTTSFSYCCVFLILMIEQQTEYSAKTSSRWLYVDDMTNKSLVQRRSFYSSEDFLFHVIYSSSRMISLKWMTKRVWMT